MTASVVARPTASLGARASTEERPPARALRIAFCIDSLAASGGTELSTVRTAEQLVARGHVVHLFTLRREGAMEARYAAAGIPVEEVPVRSLVGLDTACRVRAFARRLRAGGYDVLHSHDLYTNVVATAAGRLAGVPAVIASKRWTEWYRPAHRTLNRIAYRFAHGVVGNSARVGETLRDADAVPGARVAVVPNFVEDAAFARWGAAERLDARRALEVPDEAPTVGIVARLREAARLTTEFPALRVLLVGDGPEHDALVRLAESLDVADHVVFAGHRPNRPNPHQLFDVSVLCSRHEGFPNTLVEAMAAGRPVVATRVGGVPDAVVDGETGVLVPPGDAGVLADAIGALLRDPARARHHGEAGCVRARAEFHVDVVVPRLVGLYERLLGRAAERR